MKVAEAPALHSGLIPFGGTFLEHLASLRLIPNIELWRPCDVYETAIAWREAVSRREGPSVLVLSRQGLPAMPRDEDGAAGIALGGYRLRSETRRLSLVLVATGSEVQLALAAASALEAAGYGIRVVSLPCVERFLAQPVQFRNAVLPRDVPVLGVEAGHPAGLATAIGPGAEVHGIASFGESVEAVVEAVVEHARRMIEPC